MIVCVTVFDCAVCSLDRYCAVAFPRIFCILKSDLKVRDIFAIVYSLGKPQEHVGAIREKETRIRTYSLCFDLEMLSASCREGLADGLWDDLGNDFALSRA